MKKLCGMTVVAATLALTLGVLSTDAWAQNIKRLSAEWDYFDAGEFETDVPTSLEGETFYSKTLFVPMRTLFITLSTTGDGHGGAEHEFRCRVDDVPCTASEEWISLQLHDTEDDNHDNTIYYTWCTRVTPQTTHTVDLDLASGIDGEDVFIEAAHVYIDNTPGSCIDKTL